MIKNFNKRLFKKLNLIYIYVKNSFDIIRARQRTARTLNKRLAKNNLIHKSVNQEKYKSDDKEFKV